MKRYKNLWSKFIAQENFEIAVKKAVKSKKNKKSTKKFLMDSENLIKKLRQSLIDDSFNTSKYRVFTIFEPKKREIYELPLYPDHIVHHAIINILGPIWQHMFISDSYACIPGRGLHIASKRIMKFIRRNKYVLQCDIRKFFPSINHDVMIDILRHKIGDKRMMALLKNIVRSVGGETNLPIGNLTSQWMANVYLHELDMFIKHVLHCKDYLRYCDDFCLFGNDKQLLWKQFGQIKEFLDKKLKLGLSRYCLHPVTCGVNMIGYRHFKKFILLRSRGAKKIYRRLMNIAYHNDTSQHAIGQVASAHGWFKWACTYNFKRRIVSDLKTISKPLSKFISEKL